MWVRVGGLTLDGGSWLISGFLTSDKAYGVQSAQLYTENPTLKYRTRKNKVWQDWDMVITNSNLTPLLVTDANLATENRSYRLSGTALNIPWRGIGCMIESRKYDNLITQTAISNEVVPQIAIRNNYASQGWSSWKTLATK